MTTQQLSFKGPGFKQPRSRQKRELQPQANVFGGGWGLTGYQGAMNSDLRGYVYWPSLDPKMEVDSYSRQEIARKVHWLTANVGLPRRIIEGLTNLVVGTGLRPQALTSDSEWNELAEKAYNRRANSPLSFSVSGRLTSVQAQRLMMKTRFKDGDAMVVFSKSETGGALRAFYSGLRVANATGTNIDQSRWVDGIFLDSLDRSQLYRFPGAKGTFTDIPASDLCHLLRLDSPGQIRGVSVLAHAVNKLIDVCEVNTYVMQGIKNSNSIGYYLTSSAEQKSQGIGASLGGRTKTVDTGSGKVSVKMVYGSTGEIASLPHGMDLKTLLDQRPHPNSREFIEDMIRDISWGSGISSDLLWNIYKLGGANVRYVLADGQVFVQTEQQDLVDTWLARDWAYTIALEMKAGRLRPCKDQDWWVHGWIPPERITVDFGRDGKMYLDTHRSGLLTTERFFAMRGQDAREEIVKELDLIAWRKKEMSTRGITSSDLQLYGNGASQPAAVAPAAPDESAFAQIPDDEQETEDPTKD